MIDIDKFKIVNDTYGHEVGDEVLVDIALRLQNDSRDSDVVCRYGGEEFVVLLPETSKDGALVIAQKIRKDIEARKISLGNIIEVKYTVSIGVSQSYLEKDIAIEEVIKRADDALYEAKNSGRNRVFYQE